MTHTQALVDALLADPKMRAALVAALRDQGEHVHDHRCPTCARLAHARRESATIPGQGSLLDLLLYREAEASVALDRDGDVQTLSV